MQFFKNIVPHVHLATCALNKSSESLQKKAIPIVSVRHETKVVIWIFQLHISIVSARALWIGSDRYQGVCDPHLNHANKTNVGGFKRCPVQTNAPLKSKLFLLISVLLHCYA